MQIARRPHNRSHAAGRWGHAVSLEYISTRRHNESNNINRSRPTTKNTDWAQTEAQKGTDSRSCRPTNGEAEILRYEDDTVPKHIHTAEMSWLWKITGISIIQEIRNDIRMIRESLGNPNNSELFNKDSDGLDIYRECQWS